MTAHLYHPPHTMNERPPISTVLTGWQGDNLLATLKRVKDVFTERYPDATTLPSVELRCDGLRWSISHYAHPICTIGYGSTPEEAFAELDRKLGPPMSAIDRLHWRCEQLMKEAIAMEAYEVANALKAAQNPLPVSSPARQ